jgi:hypothetical protein
MRYALVFLWTLACSAPSAMAQVSIGIGGPGVSIGINVPVFPQLVLVPGYPVYYAPQLRANFFFYDGLYWVFQGDNWYVSSWYNGPWRPVLPEFVPVFVLRIPVRYYRAPPLYFHAWRPDAAPRWDEHWGGDWARQRDGWNRHDRLAAPHRAPLPLYQRHYRGERYPPEQQQQGLNSRNYRYQPRDPIVRQHFQAPHGQAALAPPERGAAGAHNGKEHGKGHARNHGGPQG